MYLNIGWTSAGTLGISCLGDSITAAASGSSYRTYLTNSIQATPYIPSWDHKPRLREMIGSQSSGLSAHDGYGGISAAQLAINIPGLSWAGLPSDALILAGINDLAALATPAQIKTRLESCRDAVLLRAPSCRVSIMLLLPNTAPSVLNVAPTNIQIAAITGLNGGTIIDTTVGWNTATMLNADGLHPNALGDQHIASRIISAWVSAGILV